MFEKVKLVKRNVSRWSNFEKCMWDTYRFHASWEDTSDFHVDLFFKRKAIWGFFDASKGESRNEIFFWCVSVFIQIGLAFKQWEDARRRNFIIVTKLFVSGTHCSGGSRIFPRGGGRQLPKWEREPNFLVENCMKMKEFWRPGGGGTRPWRPPLDPPLHWSIEDFKIHLK